MPNRASPCVLGARLRVRYLAALFVVQSAEEVALLPVLGTCAQKPRYILQILCLEVANTVLRSQLLKHLVLRSRHGACAAFTLIRQVPHEP
jgi:hypothetical protein